MWCRPVDEVLETRLLQAHQAAQPITWYRMVHTLPFGAMFVCVGLQTMLPASLKRLYFGLLVR